MKMRKTKIKFMSLLLAVMMIVGVLPTTALAATYNDVKVNGVSLGDGKYLASNSATDSNYSNTEPSSYVAWYKDGTLTLNGYKGTGIVLQGAPAADLIIKLIGDNTITTTTNEVGIQGNSAAGSITITADSGSVDAPIGRPDPDEVERWILPVERGGFPSLTHYKVLRRFESGYTLTELSLETGRTHQIRVHMASIGHPVTGDHLYNNGDPFLYRKLHGDFRRIEGDEEKSTSRYISRQALHAYRLSFIHPIAGQKLCLEAPLPEDMKKLLSDIGDADTHI